MGKWTKKSNNFSSFFQKKGKAQTISKKVHSPKKVFHKRGILSIVFTLQNGFLRSFQVLASLNWVNDGESFKCHHI